MPLTEELTFKLGDTGIILNASPTLPFVDIHRVRGLSSTPLRETERQHEGQDGGFMDAEFEQGRHVVLEGIIYADTDTMEEYLDDLKENWGPIQNAVEPFYYLSPGRPERLLFVKPLGVRYDWDPMRRIGAANVQFLAFAEDPRIYTSTLEEVVIDVNFPDNVPGFSFNFGFNFTFGATIVGNGENVVVGGNRQTPPVFTIDVTTGPCVNPKILNFTDNRQLEMNLTMQSGDTLVVDPLRRTVLLNGTSNRRDALITDEWFLLNVGTTFIGFLSDSSDDSTLTVSYRDAWR